MQRVPLRDDDRTRLGKRGPGGAAGVIDRTESTFLRDSRGSEIQNSTPSADRYALSMSPTGDLMRSNSSGGAVQVESIRDP
jgi:hypothetical protein